MLQLKVPCYDSRSGESGECSSVMNVQVIICLLVILVVSFRAVTHA